MHQRSAPHKIEGEALSPVQMVWAEQFLPGVTDAWPTSRGPEPQQASLLLSRCLYRQEHIFLRAGLAIARSTRRSGWASAAPSCSRWWTHSRPDCCATGCCTPTTRRWPCSKWAMGRPTKPALTRRRRWCSTLPSSAAARRAHIDLHRWTGKRVTGGFEAAPTRLSEGARLYRASQICPGCGPQHGRSRPSLGCH